MCGPCVLEFVEDISLLLVGSAGETCPWMVRVIRFYKG